MAIIGSLPVSLANGTTADATQVMSDLNYIVSQVNSNAAALAGGNAFTGAQTVDGDAIATLLATQTLAAKTLTAPTLTGTTTAATINASVLVKAPILNFGSATTLPSLYDDGTTVFFDALAGSNTNIGMAIRLKGTGTLALSGNQTISGTLGVTGQITGNLTGTVTGNAATATLAATATALATARAINGVNFNGTANITVNALPLSTTACVQAHRGGSDTYTSGTYTKVTPEVEDVDAGNNFATGTFTAPATGVYEYAYGCFFDATSAGELAARLYKNGSSAGAGFEMHAVSQGSAIYACLAKSGFISLTSGDTIELYMARQNGANVTTNVSYLAIAQRQ